MVNNVLYGGYLRNRPLQEQGLGWRYRPLCGIHAVTWSHLQTAVIFPWKSMTEYEILEWEDLEFCLMRSSPQMGGTILRSLKHKAFFSQKHTLFPPCQSLRIWAAVVEACVKPIIFKLLWLNTWSCKRCQNLPNSQIVHLGCLVGWNPSARQWPWTCYPTAAVHQILFLPHSSSPFEFFFITLCAALMNNSQHYNSNNAKNNPCPCSHL